MVCLPFPCTCYYPAFSSCLLIRTNASPPNWSSYLQWLLSSSSSSTVPLEYSSHHIHAITQKPITYKFQTTFPKILLIYSQPTFKALYASSLMLIPKLSLAFLIIIPFLVLLLLLTYPFLLSSAGQNIPILQNPTQIPPYL